ncbi:hypothetical protein ABK040_011961 [Willaertia magna]
MSLHFNWNEWKQEPIIELVKTKLSEIINSNIENNPILIDPLKITDFSFGTTSPKLSIENIPKLSLTQQEIHIRFFYEGNGYIKLKTRVQINQLYMPQQQSSYLGYSLGIGNRLIGQYPTDLPVEVAVSDLKLDGIIIIKLENDFIQNINLKNVLNKNEVPMDRNINIYIQLKNNPLERLDISTIFEEAIPQTKNLLLNIIKKQIDNGVLEVMKEAKKITINLNELI